MESVPKPPPRRGHLKAHDGDMQKKEGALPALGQGEKGKAASGSFPQRGLPAFVICGENLFCGDADDVFPSQFQWDFCPSAAHR